jgi:hypothetical protein
MLKEIQIQKQYFDWVKIMRNKDWRYRLIYPIPNFGKRNPKNAAAEGITAGLWDVSIDIANLGYNGMKLEFKSEKGKLTKEQKSMKDLYLKAGILCFVCKSFEYAQNLTTKYLGK